MGISPVLSGEDARRYIKPAFLYRVRLNNGVAILSAMTAKSDK
jgi:hypothetical protein